MGWGGAHSEGGGESGEITARRYDESERKRGEKEIRVEEKRRREDNEVTRRSEYIKEEKRREEERIGAHEKREVNRNNDKDSITLPREPDIWKINFLHGFHYCHEYRCSVSFLFRRDGVLPFRINNTHTCRVALLE
jgi:hypothetical protein